jgi:hypothetical protein
MILEQEALAVKSPLSRENRKEKILEKGQEQQRR